ncbi:MAG: 2-dehydropantoate 2-reductase [Microvirga sp.]|nr:2-dehydropantoate 2-reductase [Microvirga sp.]
MRIAVLAPGAVGGYFGGLLAKAGENIAALARGAHLAAIRENGLRIEGPDGEYRVRLDVSDDAAQLGSADVVLFAVKLYQAAAAARAAASLFGPETVAISLLNGVTGPEIITDALPGSTVLGGCAYVSAVIAAPGYIRHNGAMSAIVVGTPEGSSARAKTAEFVERCRRAGFGAEMTGDVRTALWTKMIGLSANAALTSAAGLLYADPDVLAAAAGLIGEAAAVARALGMAVADDIEEVALRQLKGFPPGMYASL